MRNPLGAWIWRCLAEMTPVVSVRLSPNGLPIAIAGSPTWTSLAEPSWSGRSVSPSVATLSRARSVDVSRPMIFASTVLESENWTVTLTAPSTTWALVRMSPLLSMTKPEPVASPRCSVGNRSNGDWLRWTICARTNATPGASRR